MYEMRRGSRPQLRASGLSAFKDAAELREIDRGYIAIAASVAEEPVESLNAIINRTSFGLTCPYIQFR
jgi:hypothetical protein